jgi:cytochrome c
MQRKLNYLWRGLKGVATGIAICSLSNGDGLAQNTSSPFTQIEVMAGHADYHDYCAGCHGDELQGGGLQGGGDAPQLTGPNFNQDWSKQTIHVLYRYASQTMPDGLEGDLSAKSYSDILSFLLAANGAKPGSVPFDPDSDIKIGDIANGMLVTAVTDAPVDAQAKAMH